MLLSNKELLLPYFIDYTCWHRITQDYARKPEAKQEPELSFKSPASISTERCPPSPILQEAEAKGKHSL